MNYSISNKNSEPAYIQLYRQLVRDISEGIYHYGDKLPSKRIIAEETGVSVITVEHALTLLNEEGYAESRQRSGVFVTYKDEDSVSGGGDKEEFDFDYTGSQKSDIHLRVGDFPFSVLAKTMRKVILDYGEKLLVKSPNQGCPELREEICRYLARSRHLHIRPEQVIVGSGAEYLYGLIVQMFGNDVVYGLESPSYSRIFEVYNSMGAKCDFLKMTLGGIDSGALLKTKAKILHVTPFNSYPSGATADISKKREYLKWARENDAILIEDNYDSELTVSRKAEDPLYSMDKESRVIYLNTFSRTIAPSMRIGYMVLPPGMLKLFDEKLGFYSCTVPIFDQYVLAELIKSGDFERHINRVRRNRRKNL
ncbi:MAG: PLP-dependent aminotransferase family protein [Lachnospiraceae bacterium]|nr:PLP-dependent aminotransferase family protein [Lachnospiraceae bacterium]MBR1649824.1 PLP-dependent aminotransferase family protein [Lachnospiraceae bacterium]